MVSQLYRIGVDVGGTNTDCALACASATRDCSSPDIQIVGSHKTRTTDDVTTGICSAIDQVLKRSCAPRSDILSINIGTTHFINAVVQADATKLSKVAVLRLCGPFCREVPPFSDFPPKLRATVAGHVGYLSGGLEIDGRPIALMDEQEVVQHAQQIKERGIRAVVVIGVFSSVDNAECTQEQRVREILNEYIPDVDVVCSRDIGHAGFVERENASVLNASILQFGRKTIRNFQKAIDALGIHCPLFLTQNDGTVIDAFGASRVPIRTFSCGPTNSLSGAVFLSGIHQGKSDIDLAMSQVLMLDIGGGVRTAFSMPEVLSIGLGGGSKVVSSDRGQVTVGPVSVGSSLELESQCFGGPVLTATDIVVASGRAASIKACWSEPPLPETVAKARDNIQKQIERGVSAMKTSDADVVLTLVGGGSFLQIDELRNVKRCIQPPFYDVANAVGAAIAKVSGVVDCIVIPGGRSHDEILREIKHEAIQSACRKGALPETVGIVEIEVIPLQYVNNGECQAIVKAVGQLGWQRMQSPHNRETNGGALAYFAEPSTNGLNPQPPETEAGTETGPSATTDPSLYEPNVSKQTGEWFISEEDLSFIAEGVGILGTGGGGSVYTTYMHSLDVLRTSKPRKVRVVDPMALSPDSQTFCIAYAGAPSVSNERLIGNEEFNEAASTLAKHVGIPGFSGVLSAEIGGSNGLRAFATAAAMDVPVIDADFLGRAFPRVDMSLPYVYGAATPTPAVLSDPRGNVQVIASVDNARRFEDLMRVSCIQLGLFTAVSLAPLSGTVMQAYTCHRSLSAAWFLGRAIKTARYRKTDFVEALNTVFPGCRKLYEGKIINVKREVKGGWTIGTATIESVDADGAKPDTDAVPLPLILQYQNEFLYAAHVHPDSSSTQICTTPDMISVLDQDGTALATHEIRYGLLVSVIAMPGHKLWKTPTGMKAAGPRSFGLDMDYTPFPGDEFLEYPSVVGQFAK